MLCSRGWSEITTFHWVRMAGFSRLKSRLQTRPIRARISARSMGRSASFGGRTGRSSGRLYGLDTASRLYRIQVFTLFKLNYQFNDSTLEFVKSDLKFFYLNTGFTYNGINTRGNCLIKRINAKIFSIKFITRCISKQYHKRNTNSKLSNRIKFTDDK